MKEIKDKVRGAAWFDDGGFGYEYDPYEDAFPIDLELKGKDDFDIMDAGIKAFVEMSKRIPNLESGYLNVKSPHMTWVLPYDIHRPVDIQAKHWIDVISVPEHQRYDVQRMYEYRNNREKFKVTIDN